MASVSPVVQQNGATKATRPAPPSIQTNGTPSSATASSPTSTIKKLSLGAKQTPSSAADRSVTASTVRPINRNKRETPGQGLGRLSRNSAGIRSASLAADAAAHGHGPPPYIVKASDILRKFTGHPPSLVVHLYPTHFRFDGQDSIFPYKSPMKIFMEHLKARTVPHELLEWLAPANVSFYDGCLIVQVHDHKTPALKKDATPAASASSTVVASSIHNYNQWLTPSPLVAFPKDESSPGQPGEKVEDEPKPSASEDAGREVTAASSLPADIQKSKTPPNPKIYTLVLKPTPESLATDLHLKATQRVGSDGRENVDSSRVAPSSTPLSLGPTSASTSMPPPAKRQKQEKNDLDATNIHAAEGQILLATTANLYLEPTSSKEETIALLEVMSHPEHSEPPPQPKTRKRTVAEVAADEAAAADQERYMLVLDERLSSGAAGAQSTGAMDGDAQAGASTFDPRFERFKVIDDIKREHAEKKEQEKAKQAENDRKLQLQRQQQQLQQQQQQEQLIQAQRQQAEAERARREAAAVRENQLRQQAENARARAAASTPVAQNAGLNMGQQHAHPNQQGVMPNGMPNNVQQGGSNAMAAQAQRFQAQMSQAQVSSPVVAQNTPQNMSSPMVGSVPMQQTSSTMAASPPRPSSVAQNHSMSAPMAHSMSGRGSQQSHPSNTPRMPNATPNMAHGTPINRASMAGTPRMTQTSPPPGAMAQTPQMNQAMMMGGQNMQQQPPNPQLIAQMAAQQRAIAQQQQMAASMQNGAVNGNVNGNMNGQAMSPSQQQQMLQYRQMMAQQVNQQQQQQGGMLNPQQQQQITQQYAQQLQNMQAQAQQRGQITPQMQAQIQQMARMGQMGGQMGNPMQRQGSGAIANGANPNMQAFLQMQQQQQQQQQAQAQAQAQAQQQQQQQLTPQQQQQQILQQQIQNTARGLFQRQLGIMSEKFSGSTNIPPEMIERMKQQAYTQAQQMMQQGMAQRRAQQQQQQALLQQQQQQQAAMQNMGGMMGHQGM